MKIKEKKYIDSVGFFRGIKEKLAEKMANMTLEEQKEYLKKIRSGEIKFNS